MSEKTTVRLIRAFQGPRHDQLERVWDTIAEYCADQIILRPFDNLKKGLRHDEAFQRIWLDERRGSGPLLLTEYDFLPDLHADWIPLDRLGEQQGLGCMYATRSPHSFQLKRHEDKAGGWYVLLNREKIDCDLDFEGSPDACNQLPEQISMDLDPGEDCFPISYGITYPFGTHCFWSRHLHDDPERTVSGFKLGEIQEAHDYFLSVWMELQPEDFKALYEYRHGHASPIRSLLTDNGPQPRRHAAAASS